MDVLGGLIAGRRWWPCIKQRMKRAAKYTPGNKMMQGSARRAK
jgi:hypothetical protein